MVNIILALPKLEDARIVKNILVRSGFAITAVCTTGAQAINYADGLHDGIIICNFKQMDMVYSELFECMPPGFEMLLMASQKVISENSTEGLVTLSFPMKANDLVNTVSMMADNIERRRRKKRLKPAQRSEEDIKIIQTAKELLMERNNMTNDEAHKYLQKCSMDSGNNMVETAGMILDMMK